MVSLLLVAAGLASVLVAAVAALWLARRAPKRVERRIPVPYASWAEFMRDVADLEVPIDEILARCGGALPRKPGVACLACGVETLGEWFDTLDSVGCPPAEQPTRSELTHHESVRGLRRRGDPRPRGRGADAPAPGVPRRLGSVSLLSAVRRAHAVKPLLLAVAALGACTPPPASRVDIELRNAFENSRVVIKASSGGVSRTIDLAPGETWQGWILNRVGARVEVELRPRP